MFKKLLSALTVMLLAFGMNAEAQKLEMSDLSVKAPNYVSKNVMKTAIKPAPNEKWLGYWGGDVENIYQLGMQRTPMDYGVAICFPADTKEVTGKVIEGIRFSFPDVTNVRNVKVFLGTELPANLQSDANICTDDVKEVVGFASKNEYLNEIRFSKPYRVLPGKPVYIGYTFSVIGGNTNNDNYPILFQKTADVKNALILNAGNSGWLDYYGQKAGIAFMQALVSTREIVDNDVSLEEKAYVGISKDALELPASVVNFGAKGLSSLEVETDINGIKTVYESKPSKAIKGIGEKYSFKIPVNAPEGTGKFNYSIKVTKINGEPVKKDIAISGICAILSRIVQHKVLAEEFTGMWCGWCPRGFVALEKMEQVYGDKVVRLAAHYNDPLFCKDYSNVIAAAGGHFPGLNVDRNVKAVDPYYGPTEEDFGIRYSIDECMSANPVAEIVSKPLLEGDNLIARAEATFLYGGDASDYAIGFVLTENGMTDPSWAQTNNYAQFKGQGLEKIEPLFEPWVNGQSSRRGVVYNEVVQAAYGMENGAAGSVPETVKEEEVVAYAKVFNLAGNKKIQNRDNLNLITVLFDTKTGYVINSDIMSVKEGTAGIEDVATNGNVVEIARYTVDGRRINNAVKGINIVKYSDGTVKKVLVK